MSKEVELYEAKLEYVQAYVKEHGKVTLITDANTAMQINKVFSSECYEQCISINLENEVAEYLIEINEGISFCIEPLIRAGKFYAIQAKEIIVDFEILEENPLLLDFLTYDKLLVFYVDKEEVEDEMDNYCDSECKGLGECYCDSEDCEYKKEIAEDISETIDFYASMFAILTNKVDIKDAIVDLLSELDEAVTIENDEVDEENLNYEDLLALVMKKISELGLR